MTTHLPGDLIGLDPDAVNQPYGFDWTDYLAEIDAAEVIVSSTWAITGPDTTLTTANGSIVTGSKQTQIRLSGGTLGQVYLVTNSIITNSGVQDDRSFSVLLQEA